jgi:hypothetical protein
MQSDAPNHQFFPNVRLTFLTYFKFNQLLTRDFTIALNRSTIMKTMCYRFVYIKNIRSFRIKLIMQKEVNLKKTTIFLT